MRLREQTPFSALGFRPSSFTRLENSFVSQASSPSEITYGKGHSRPQKTPRARRFLVTWFLQIKPSGSGDENG